MLSEKFQAGEHIQVRLYGRSDRLDEYAKIIVQEFTSRGIAAKSRTWRDWRPMLSYQRVIIEIEINDPPIPPATENSAGDTDRV